jgi:hypothetical protein
MPDLATGELGWNAVFEAPEGETTVRGDENKVGGCTMNMPTTSTLKIKGVRSRKPGSVREELAPAPSSDPSARTDTGSVGTRLGIPCIPRSMGV